MNKGLKVAAIIVAIGWMISCSTPSTSKRNVPAVNGVIHVVHEGETVNAIAKTYEMSPQLLVRRNNLREGDTLKPGTRLFIPGASELRVVKVKESDPMIREARDGLLHKVGPGETLIAIANAYNVSMAELQRVNNLPDPSKIYPNQEIWIPRGKEVKDVEVPKVAVISPESIKQEKKETRTSTKAKSTTTAEKNSIAQANIPSSTSTANTSASSTSVKNASSTAESVEFPRKIKELGSIKMQWPLKDTFTFLRGFSKASGNLNPGVDLGAAVGSDVCAAADGEVIMVGGVSDVLGRGLGNHIILYHGDRENKEIYTLYAHNSQNLVKSGEKVKRGQLIAKVGNTGHTANGEGGGGLLHFEVREQTESIDPLTVLPPLK